MSDPLSKQTIDTVKATIPFLMENGRALTDHFYKRLFEGNPEVKAYFNTANQAGGTQQAALGGAICAFAQNIETPENLESAIERISNKHASLGVKPEHYPVVGEHLLGSIDDLLNPAPKEVLDAWAEAYGFLAGVMISAEENLYTSQREKEHGWNDFKHFTVTRRKKESELITSFYLKPSDGAGVPNFKAGQYLTVRFPQGDSTTMRNYSLSGSNQWDEYRISVKREDAHQSDTPDGYVSHYLHEKVAVGSEIEVAPPCGDFFLHENVGNPPILFIAGGVGITPLLSMLHACKPGQPVTFIQCSINGQHHAFRAELRELAEEKGATLHFRYSNPSEQDALEKHFHSEGFTNTEFLREFLTPDTQVYFCGPMPMMNNINASLKELDHPVQQTHSEVFAPQA